MEIVGVLILEVISLYFLARNLQKGFGLLFYKVTKSQKLTVYLLALLFLPGTFIHEISHFLTALFLLVPVGKLELMPEFIGEGQVKMGSVEVGKTDPIRRFLVGIAPLVIGVSTILTITYLVTSNNLLQNIWIVFGAGFLIFQISNTMFLSRRDLEGSWKLLVGLIVIFVALYFLGFRADPNKFGLMLSEEVKHLLSIAAGFLAVPLAIDFVFVLLFKILGLGREA